MSYPYQLLVKIFSFTSFIREFFEIGKRVPNVYAHTITTVIIYSMKKLIFSIIATTSLVDVVET